MPGGRTLDPLWIGFIRFRYDTFAAFSAVCSNAAVRDYDGSSAPLNQLTNRSRQIWQWSGLLSYAELSGP